MRTFSKKIYFLILFLTYLLFTPSSLLAADQCGTSNYSTTLSTPSPTYANNDIVYWYPNNSWNYQTYYVNVLEAGTVTVSVTNTNGGYAKFTYDENGCPNYNDTYQTTKSYIFSTPTDFNVYVDALQTDSNDQHYTINITFTPAGPPSINPQTFSIYKDAPVGTLIDSVVATNTPTAFSINSGNIDNLFSIDNNGDITVALSLDNNSTTSYNLNVSATNSNGTNSAIVTINIVDDIPLSTDLVNTRPFTNVPILGKNSATINGSLLQIGNQLLCRNSFNGDTCIAPSLNTPNNNYTQYRAKIDTSVGAPSSNTMAKLLFQSGDEVLFARLYWSARKYSPDSTDMENGKKIQIKGPNDSVYTQLTSKNSKYNWHQSGSTFDYVASADVTDYITNNGAGEYYVGGIMSESGETGLYASWQLVVIVKNQNRSLKNIAIYDGFYSIFNSTGYPASITVPASGFITPTGTDPFNASLFVYAGESDSSYGDSSEVKDGANNWIALVDGANTPNDVMNASIYSSDYTGGYRSNDAGMANPNFRNVLGVDIDKLLINDKYDTSKQSLSNSQTSTEIRLSSSGDRYSLNMFAFETEVFVPEFCYDYAYSQFDQFFTENNDGTKAPKLFGTVVTNEPIELTIFLRSMVESSIQIQNMTIEISDINRTQAIYIPSSTKLSLVGTTTKQPITVTETTIGNEDKISDIDIGTLNQNDYFYLYYSLNPKLTTLDMPITVDATYNLVLDTASVGYTLRLSEQIPLCTNSDFNYRPAKGIYNVAHNDFYTWDGSSGNPYYNLPTQVTKREGNFKVLSMDSNDFDLLNNNHPLTIAAVEMIDAGAFHYTNASCKEIDSSISERVWVLFDANTTSVPFNKAAIESAITNGMTKLTGSTDFYAQARQNTAFRVTYNSADENGSILQLTTNGSTYSISNFTLAGQSCIQDINENNNTADDAVDTYCTNNATNLTKAELATCMECIYGIDTRFICSRDNFAIRPEAFLMQIDDVNQTNSISKVDITTLNNSGSNNAVAPILDLSAGYAYNIEVNATNHINNLSSKGYTKTFNLTSDDTAKYIWEPRAGIVSGVCNDENNQTVPMKLTNGLVSTNLSLNQVGEYRLNILDTTWTTVDNDPAYMTHHTGIYFLPSSTLDCILNSSVTQNINISALNGCNIDSSHINNDANLSYNDYNITFHPYKFNLSSITPSIGLNNDPIGTNAYLYMADMTQEDSMSYHLNGTIVAEGENNSTLSNFVDGCYAQALDISINKSTLILPTSYQYRLHLFDSNSSEIGTATKADLNNTRIIALSSTAFTKALAGSASTKLNLNYNREKNNAINPQEITFSNYDVNCTTPANCTFNGDLINDKTTQGKKDLNSSTPIRHYYGRTNGLRQRFAGSNGNALIYYEVYCNGGVCDKTLLQNGLESNSTNDPRWFINTTHVPNLGSVGVVSQKGFSANVGSATPTTTAPSTVTLNYNGTGGYPYKATMENNASSWLIYNPFNANATTNQFEVEFSNTDSAWAGQAESNTKTNTDATIRTNRRTMW